MVKSYTRQIYTLEVNKYELPSELIELRPVRELRDWIAFYWAHTARRDKTADPPKVLGGKGLKMRGRRWSYYDADKHLIVFSRYQRNRITALHELVHALGFGVNREHDDSFVREYFRVLKLTGQPGWWCDEQRDKILLPQP